MVAPCTSTSCSALSLFFSPGLTQPGHVRQVFMTVSQRITAELCWKGGTCSLGTNGKDHSHLALNPVYPPRRPWLHQKCVFIPADKREVLQIPLLPSGCVHCPCSEEGPWWSWGSKGENSPRRESVAPSTVGGQPASMLNFSIPPPVQAPE